MAKFTGKYDYVGSFLRPPKLVAAQVAYKEGEIGKDRLKLVEDEAITDLIAKQKELGYPFLTNSTYIPPPLRWWDVSASVLCRASSPVSDRQNNNFPII